MRFLISFTLAVVALTALVPELRASIIRVGPGGDFSDIQPAIDAASDGDVILVDPGTYTTFRLNKGVVIRSAAAGEKFNVQASATVQYVLVENTTPRQKCAIAGMKLLWEFVDNVGCDTFLWVRNCQGEVVLEDLDLVVDTKGSGCYSPN